MTRTRARGSAASNLQGRKRSPTLPGKSRFCRELGAGRAATALALGLALLAGALLFLWRSADPRAKDDPARPTPREPAAEAKETAPEILQAAPEPDLGERGEGDDREDDERAPGDGAATARLTVVARAPASLVLGDMLLELGDAAGRTVSATLARNEPRASLELAPGVYTLALTHPGPPLLASSPLRLELGPGEERSEDVTLLSCWRCAGFVSDDGERGLEGLALTLERPGAEALTTFTDALGRFAFPPLPEGPVTLAVGDPLGPIVPRLELTLGAASEALEIRVPALLELTLRVVDADGLPVDGASVEGLGERGGRVEGTSDADGLLVARALPPGNYRVFASQARVGRGNRIFVLTAESAMPVEIELLTERPPR